MQLKLFQVFFRFAHKQGSLFFRAQNKWEAKRLFWDKINSVGIDIESIPVSIIALNKINEKPWEHSFNHRRYGRA